jgi:hypothetical protein
MTRPPRNSSGGPPPRSLGSLTAENWWSRAWYQMPLWRPDGKSLRPKSLDRVYGGVPARDADTAGSQPSPGP